LYFSEKVFKSPSFTLPLSRKELGNFIGTSREAITKTITKLKEDQIIVVKNKELTIVDFDKLTRISKIG
jgi:CRP-like cAMP-binding protein